MMQRAFNFLLRFRARAIPLIIQKNLVYRICNNKYAHKLTASGRENRWNNENKFILYTASSLSLACLEIIVHSSGELLYKNAYSSVIIKVPDDALITMVELRTLPPNWKQLSQKDITQKIGNEWYNKKETLLLGVPSAIIQK